MSDDWKWHDPDAKEAIVVPSVQAIAVYTNPAGDIVIRQEGYGYGDQPGDSVVVVPRKMIAALTKALRTEAAKDFTPD